MRNENENFNKKTEEREWNEKGKPFLVENVFKEEFQSASLWRVQHTWIKAIEQMYDTKMFLKAEHRPHKTDILLCRKIA